MEMFYIIGLFILLAWTAIMCVKESSGGKDYLKTPLDKTILKDQIIDSEEWLEFFAQDVQEDEPPEEIAPKQIPRPVIPYARNIPAPIVTLKSVGTPSPLPESVTPEPKTLPAVPRVRQIGGSSMPRRGQF